MARRLSYSGLLHRLEGWEQTLCMYTLDELGSESDLTSLVSREKFCLLFEIDKKEDSTCRTFEMGA